MTLHGRTISLVDFGFEFVTVEEGTGSNAYHIPQGALLVYDPHVAVNGAAVRNEGRPEISTLDIAPTILANYGIPAPAYMRKACAIG